MGARGSSASSCSAWGTGSKNPVGVEDSFASQLSKALSRDPVWSATSRGPQPFHGTQGSMAHRI